MVEPEDFTWSDHPDRTWRWQVYVGGEDFAVAEDADGNERVDECWMVPAGTPLNVETLREAAIAFMRKYETKAVSRCTECGQRIDWSGTFWLARDTEDWAICIAGEGGLHRPLWLTLGELRDKLAHLPDHTPLTAYVDTNEDFSVTPGTWVNLGLPADIPTEWPQDGSGESSLVLDVHDNFDTRQW